ncbi:MAG TPA: hypothetical protein PLL66_03700, partial [Bacteroidales bacterium]|nr:hypothetical protein [Bacteroidales bacterium]
MKTKLIILAFSLISSFVLSQNIDKDSITYTNPSKLNIASQELLNSISQGDSDEIVASKYYNVAVELIKM